MSFKEAIEKGILVDYKIVAIGVDDIDIQKAIQMRNFTAAESTTADEIANNYALDKFMQEYAANHVLTFHSRVDGAKEFVERHKKYFGFKAIRHVSGKMSTSVRNLILNDFRKAGHAIVSNARCLTEGVDIPAIDGVYFCDPKESQVDIVQAVGRALRRADHKGKELGYIVVPVYHRKSESVEEMIENSAFKNLVKVVRAMCNHDESLIDEITKLKLSKGKLLAQCGRIEFMNIATHISEMDAEEFREKIFTEVLNRMPVQWRSFEDAQEFARSLGISSVKEWRVFSKTNDMPIDIPVNPDIFYKNKGWGSWPNWLNNGNFKNVIYRNFEEARCFVHGLTLCNQEEWVEYCKSGNKPHDIPSNPNKEYKGNFKGYGDWLGTGRVSNQNMRYRGFEEAKEFVRQLNLKNTQEWKEYSKSPAKPFDIPAAPWQVYSNIGWENMGDWLGTNFIATHKRREIYLNFHDARIKVHKLGFQTQEEWKEYCVGDKPLEIPSHPELVYKNKGWVSLSNWLGTAS